MIEPINTCCQKELTSIKLSPFLKIPIIITPAKTPRTVPLPPKKLAEQMSKDVTNFLMWSAEPHLEQRHKTGFRVIAYLIILTVLVYFTMKKIWSRVEPKI